MPSPSQPLPHHIHGDDTVAAFALPKHCGACPGAGRLSCLPCWGSPFSSPGLSVRWRVPPWMGAAACSWPGVGEDRCFKQKAGKGWEEDASSLAMRGSVGTHEGPGPGEGLWKVGERLSGGWSHPQCPQQKSGAEPAGERKGTGASPSATLSSRATHGCSGRGTLPCGLGGWHKARGFHPEAVAKTPWAGLGEEWCPQTPRNRQAKDLPPAQMCDSWMSTAWFKKRVLMLIWWQATGGSGVRKA